MFRSRNHFFCGNIYHIIFFYSVHILCFNFRMIFLSITEAHRQLSLMIQNHFKFCTIASLFSAHHSSDFHIIRAKHALQFVNKQLLFYLFCNGFLTAFPERFQ